MELKVINLSGKEVEKIQVNDEIFATEYNEALIHQIIVAQLANKRQGTKSTLSRSEVRGGGIKPWRQKGTGRARAGTIRSPLWRKGGIVFGPKPRDYAYHLPRKKARLAIKSVLSAKVSAGEIMVLDQLAFTEPKTKQMLEVLAKLKVEPKVLVVTADHNDHVQKSSRNIAGVKSLEAEGINVYDLVKYDRLLITKDAVVRIEEVFS